MMRLSRCMDDVMRSGGPRDMREAGGGYYGRSVQGHTDLYGGDARDASDEDIADALAMTRPVQETSLFETIALVLITEARRRRRRRRRARARISGVWPVSAYGDDGCCDGGGGDGG